MKKILKLMAVVAALLLFVWGCNKVSNVILVSRISLSETAVTLRKGDVKMLQVTLTPSSADDQRVVWSSSNSNIASVSDGLITAVEVGKATVRATSADGRKRATCEVEVIPEYIPVESVLITDEDGVTPLNDTQVTLTEGDTYVAMASVRPGDATNTHVSWKSSNTVVASVKDGVVKAGSVGTATITVTSDAGSKTASFTVKVKAYVPPVDVTGVTLNKTSITLAKLGDSFQLTPTVAPADASNKDVRWSSADSKIATVENGLVKAIAPGKTTITVRTVDQGKTATCAVEVRGYVTGVSLNKSNLTLSVGGTATLSASVLPSDAINKNVTWTSSDDSVLTVDANGKVTAVTSGIATVTVTTEEGNFAAKCTIIVVAGDSTGTNGGFDEFNESDFDW